MALGAIPCVQHRLVQCLCPCAVHVLGYRYSKMFAYLAVSDGDLDRLRKRSTEGRLWDACVSRNINLLEIFLHHDLADSLQYNIDVHAFIIAYLHVWTTSPTRS